MKNHDRVSDLREMMNLRRRGWTYEQIAQKIGITRQAVQQRFGAFGLLDLSKEIRRLSLLDYRQKEFAKLYKEGLTDAKICELVKCSEQLVKEWRASRGLDPNHRSFQPRKLTYDLQQECRSLLMQGLSDQKIASQVGVSLITISRWRWRNGLAPGTSQNKKTNVPAS